MESRDSTICGGIGRWPSPTVCLLGLADGGGQRGMCHHAPRDDRPALDPLARVLRTNRTVQQYSTMKRVGRLAHGSLVGPHRFTAPVPSHLLYSRGHCSRGWGLMRPHDQKELPSTKTSQPSWHSWEGQRSTVGTVQRRRNLGRPPSSGLVASLPSLRGRDPGTCHRISIGPASALFIVPFIPPLAPHCSLIDRPPSSRPEPATLPALPVFCTTFPSFTHRSPLMASSLPFGASVVPSNDAQPGHGTLSRPNMTLDTPELTPVVSRSDYGNDSPYLDKPPPNSPFYMHPPASFERVHSPATSKANLAYADKDLEPGHGHPWTAHDDENPFASKVPPAPASHSPKQALRVNGGNSGVLTNQRREAGGVSRSRSTSPWKTDSDTF
nr:hypothetical protein CFP56_04524 [Quercus suber]